MTKRGDRVMTPAWAAKDIIEYFSPAGKVLEPFRGKGVFTDLCPTWDWCELDEGRDFFAYTDRVDWVVSNPPYSKLRPVWRHAATISDNIVYLIPLRNFFSGYGFVKEAFAYGGIPSIRLYGTGSRLNFPMGNAIGAVHWRRGYTGATKWSDASDKALNVEPRR